MLSAYTPGMSNLKPLVTVRQTPKEGEKFTNAVLQVYEDKVVFSDDNYGSPIEIPYDQIKDVESNYEPVRDTTADLTIVANRKKSYTVPNAEHRLLIIARKTIYSKIHPIKEQKRINRLPLQYYFHHIAIESKDLLESEKFYYGLEFEKVYEYEDDVLSLIHLKNGYCILEIYSIKTSSTDESLISREQDIPLNGVKHFALKVPVVERAKKDLTLKGIDPLTEILDGKTGIKHFFIKDPDGTIIEIVEDDRDLDPYLVQSNNQKHLP